MINQAAVKPASDIVESLSFNGKKLVPKDHPFVPISPLVSSIAGFSESTDLNSLVSLSTSIGSTGYNYDEIVNTCAPKIAMIIGNIVNKCKNTIKPAVKDILNNIDIEKKRKKLMSVKVLGNVVSIDYHRLFSDELFVNLTSSYKQSGVVQATPTMETFTILSDLAKVISEDKKDILIKTGSDTLDSKAADYFKLNNISVPVSDLPQLYGEVSSIDVEVCVYLFLLLSGIALQKIPEVETYMAQPSYQKIVYQFRGLLGARINNYCTTFDNALNRGDLFASPALISKGNYYIGVQSSEPSGIPSYYVIGATYRAWSKEKDVGPEAIIGYRIAPNYMVADEASFKQNPYPFVDYYNSRLQIAKDKVLLDEKNIIRKELRDYIGDIIYRTDDIVDKEAANLKLAEALQHDYYGPAELHRYVIKVVCRAITEGNEVLFYMMSIDMMMNEWTNNGTTQITDAERTILVEKAAYLSTIKLIAKWICAGFTVEVMK